MVFPGVSQSGEVETWPPGELCGVPSGPSEYWNLIDSDEFRHDDEGGGVLSPRWLLPQRWDLTWVPCLEKEAV